MLGNAQDTKSHPAHPGYVNQRAFERREIYYPGNMIKVPAGMNNHQ